MRPRKEIMADLAKRTKEIGQPGDMAPFFDLTVLEVLLDIRDLLARTKRQSAVLSDA